MFLERMISVARSLRNRRSARHDSIFGCGPGDPFAEVLSTTKALKDALTARAEFRHDCGTAAERISAAEAWLNRGAEVTEAQEQYAKAFERWKSVRSEMS